MKHFVLTILQFYYFVNLKLPTLISVLPRSLLKRFRPFAGVERSYRVREGTFLFMMGMFDLFVCLFLKQNYDSLPSPLSNLEPFVFRSPKFNSENKTLLYKLPLQG